MEVGIESLNAFEIVRGIFTLAFVVISILIGIKIMLKYFTFKRKEYIAVGLTWVFISSPWWGNAFSFLSIVLFRYAFEPFLYLLLMSAFVPLALMCWIYSITKLSYPELKNKLIIPYFTICIVYILYLLIALCIDTRLIGEQKGLFDFQRTLIPNLFTYFAIANTIILGVLFARSSIKSPDPQVQWKGKFMLIAILSFVAAAAIDSIFVGQYFILRAVLRLVLITSGVEYYLAFFLPEKLANKLIKEQA
ncbi:MAG: hypothetical protein ACFFAO_20570 [Candidatus Hermodarchaeota archaeon]